MPNAAIKPMETPTSVLADLIAAARVAVSDAYAWAEVEKKTKAAPRERRFQVMGKEDMEAGIVSVYDDGRFYYFILVDDKLRPVSYGEAPLALVELWAAEIAEKEGVGNA